MQSTSPQRAKDVFLRIGLSLGKAGLKRLPSHDYLPSFGDWGCWLAWQRDEPVTSMRARLATSATLHDELRYLTKDKLATVFTFGKRQLEPPWAHRQHKTAPCTDSLLPPRFHALLVTASSQVATMARTSVSLHLVAILSFGRNGVRTQMIALANAA